MVERVLVELAALAGPAAERALMALFRRLLCRAALFRCVRPLLTMLATSAAPALKAVAAAVVSPSSIALTT